MRLALHARCPVRSLAALLGLLLLPLACRSARWQRPARPLFPRAEAHEPRERSYDVLHYALDLTLLPQERRIEGECRIRLQPMQDPLHEVRLDLVGLAVRGVSDGGGRELSFTHDGTTLLVQLAETLPRGASTELVVSYGGTPCTGLWFSGQRLDGTGPTIAFTHGQAEHSRGWFPCFDEPSERATSEVRVTMPAGWLAVAPGERVSASEGEGRRTEHWRMETPHPSYLASLVAGELVVHEERWDGIPLLYLAEPCYEDWIEDTFAETDEILAFLSDYTGIRYPYPKYSQAAVANFPWGGMENISATTLTPLVLSDARSLRDESPSGLLAHEAAHQWFGDLLTCADWSHLWLNEGLATYLALLYVEAARGVDEFRAQLRDAQEAYLAQDLGPARRPTVWNVWKEPEDLFDTRVYQGAAARLHCLRFLLGDEPFRAGLRAYAAENSGRSVVTADFQRALERISGRDLDVFFAQWFLGRGYPEFRVDWGWDERAGEVDLTVEQVQRTDDGTPSAFQVPVEVEVRDERGTRSFRLEIDERRERFELPLDARPLYVRFDPHGWIPKRLEQSPGAAEWLAMARSEEDVNGRRDAVRALGALAEAARRNGDAAGDTYAFELANRLRGDASSHVRAEAAAALGRSGGSQAADALRLAAVEDREARVRVAALDALRAFAPGDELAAFAREVFEQGYSWNTMAAAAGLVCAAEPARAFDWLVQQLYVDSPHDQLCARLLQHLAALPDGRVRAELRRWAGDESLGPAARAVALDVLSASSRARAEDSRFLEPFLEEEGFHLRRSAVQALARLGDPGARNALQAYYPSARTSEERRIIESVLDRPSL